METDREANPGTRDKPPSQVTPVTQEAEGASSAGQQPGALGKTAQTGFERAGSFVKEAANKAHEKVGEYRERGMEQVSQDVVEYTRSQPVTALLIAAGAGLFLGMLLALDRRK
jgi:ElaB/YqjD/DUF883 family membrane-anchored ribosome-binding protein